MKNKYFGFICMIILASFLIKSALALTPYKMEVKELPIKGYDVSNGESKPSIFGSIIAYRSGNNQISIYNTNTNTSKIIAEEGIKILNPKVYGNYVLYKVLYRDNFAELKKYNLLTEKTYIVMPMQYSTKYLIENNKAIGFAYCGLYPDAEDCKVKLYHNSDNLNLVIIPLDFDYDYPPSEGFTKCNLNENSLYSANIDGIYVKSTFTPPEPKEDLKCKVCNILTGQTNYSNIKDCTLGNEESCGNNAPRYNSKWSVNFGDKICYTNPNIDHVLKENQNNKIMGGYKNFEAYEDSAVFLSFENGYYAEILFGDLQKICARYSTKQKIINLIINRSCSLGLNNSCDCTFYGKDENANFSQKSVASFELINLNEGKIQNTLLNLQNDIEKNLIAYADKLKRDEQERIIIQEEELRKRQELKLKLEQQKLLEQQAKIRKKVYITLAIILLITSPFSYRLIKSHLNKLKIQREKERKILEEKIRKEHERKQKEKKEREKESIRFEESQKAKGLVQYKGKWATSEQVRTWKEIEYGINSNFLDISHFDFEKFIAKLFEKMGYHVELTPKTSDYGIDIIAKDDKGKIAIQVKQYKNGNNIGNETIQNLLGAMWRMKAYKAIIITTSDFTRQARIQAEDSPIELWNLQTLKNIVRKYFIESDKTEQ